MYSLVIRKLFCEISHFFAKINLAKKCKTNAKVCEKKNSAKNKSFVFATTNCAKNL